MSETRFWNNCIDFEITQYFDGLLKKVAFGTHNLLTNTVLQREEKEEEGERERAAFLHWPQVRFHRGIRQKQTCNGGFEAFTVM